MSEAILIINGERKTVEAGVMLGASIGLSHRLETPCGGHGRCGGCKVRAWGALSPMSEWEKSLLSEAEIALDYRLACLTRILGDCEVEIPVEGRDCEVSVLTDCEMPRIVHDPLYGGYLIAVDVGTTTLALSLFDPAGKRICPANGSGWGRENPQTVLGGDVVSRMEAAMAGRGSELAAILAEALDGMIRTACIDAKIDPEMIGGGVITGNTVMLSILARMDVSGMSRAPFTPPSLFGYEVCASYLRLHSLRPDTPIALPPCIGAFLGADLVCAILGSGMTERRGPSLLADIGTNGEMALWDGADLYVTSTAAGPAFEGGGISCGMRGERGAVDRVSIGNYGLSCHVIGEGEARGVCGSGLIDAVACMLKKGDLEESGYLEEDPYLLKGDAVLTARDIRMVQQAKSAICAGLETLLAGCGRDGEGEVMPLYLAGGFGRYLNPVSAGRIGLIPSHLVPRVTPIGNAALSGASMLLLSRKAWKEAEALAKSAKAVSLAANPAFATRFMEGMMFPEDEED